jgi:hypothetical protein
MSESMITRSELTSPAVPVTLGVQTHWDNDMHESKVQLPDEMLSKYFVLIFGKMLEVFR